MRLVNIREYPVTLTLVTGLKIGASDTGMKIGGTDITVVTHPHTNEPYIPGSSLKGKFRSLHELRSGVIRYTEGKVLGLEHLARLEPDLRKIARTLLALFGVSGSEHNAHSEEPLGVTRLGIPDSFISDKCRNELQAKKLPFKEVKTENAINRITGTAEHPRTIERVPAGVEFAARFTMKIFEGDDADKFEQLLFEGCRLVELDYLGGNGTRGYGRVKFTFSGAEQERYAKTVAFP